MEVVVMLFIIIFGYIVAFTVFLPVTLLQMFSERFSHLWFSWFFSRAMFSHINKVVLPVRQQCFSMLYHEMDGRDQTVPLKILEIGIGCGSNLHMYPKNSSLIALDVNPSFKVYFEENRRKYPDVKLDKMIIGMAEDMKDIEDNSVDVVISSYVLCSVEDIDTVLKEIKRVLVDGGKYLFMEHVAYPNDCWALTLQKMIGPLWYLYTAGCRNGRDPISRLKLAKFSDLKYKRLEPPAVNIVARHQVVGLAFK